MAPDRKARAPATEGTQPLVTNGSTKAGDFAPIETIRSRRITTFIIRSLAIIQLAALSDHVWKLGLSPVYGSIPSSIAVIRPAVIVQVWLVSLLINYQATKLATEPASIDFFPFVGCLAALIQSLLFRYSGDFGPENGPLIHFYCTSYPILFLALLSNTSLTTRAIISNIPDHYMKQRFSELATNSVITIAVASVFYQSMAAFTKTAALIVGGAQSTTGSVVSSRYGLQAAMILLWMSFTQSKWMLFFGVLSFLHVVFFVPHMPLRHNTATINNTLRPSYSLLARQESLTGYISVLDNVKDGFRVLRCDHSLLGGEWINKPAGHPAQLNEPIYSIFVMLEAVRLVETESSQLIGEKVKSHKDALVIGLGIGTAPAALITHGVDTTIVEIDPVVHQFASRYFDLPSNHTSIIGDAINVVDDLRTVDARKTYDYIIHDVFTGGAEPIDLFTQEFLLGLHAILSPEGTVAINYAGDLLLPSAISVILTVTSVFPSCRMFREAPAAVPMEKEDFTNLVMFCRKSTESFTFRTPNDADLLGSPARRQHLLPQNEVINIAEMVRNKGQIIKKGQTHWLEASQRRSALGHWHVMRRVLPDLVWENW